DPTTVKSVCICSKACLLYSLWNLRGINPLHCVKRLFDPVFSDPPLLLLSTFHLLVVRSSRSHSAHAPFSVYC
ncbi:unnamed protein product, partial [Staurois parvus]